MAVKAGKVVDVIHRLIQEVKFLWNHVREDTIALSAPRVIQAGEDLIKELLNMNDNPKTTPAPAPAVFWALWVQGRPGPTVRHQSYESAAHEAKRLIIQNPSIKVDILKLIETAQATVPPIEFVTADVGTRRYAA